MLCDTCTNNRYCENEERHMCISNDFDRYDDDGSAFSPYNDYDRDIDSVKTIFEAITDESEERGSKTLYNACMSIYAVIDAALGDMMLMNCIHAIEHC